MSKRSLKILTICCFSISLLSIRVFADSKILYDKKGREVIETVSPTAETTIDPNTISDALRRKAKNVDHYVDASKNINSDAVIMPAEISILDYNNEIITDENKNTLIRHLTSYNHVDYQYELVEDRDADRLMLKLIMPDGIIYAKNGFYKIDEKVYYFDESGHMVLGPCIDNTGKTYFFSYETGEMLSD